MSEPSTQQKKSKSQVSNSDNNTPSLRWSHCTADLREFAAALCEVQAELEPATKGNVNPFFNSSYADLPAIVKVARPLLAKNKIAVVQLPTPIGNKQALVTMLIHAPSGQVVQGIWELAPKDNSEQARGSSLTFAKRYSLAAMVGIVAEGEDDDGEAAMHRDVSTKTVKPRFKKDEELI